MTPTQGIVISADTLFGLPNYGVTAVVLLSTGVYGTPNGGIIFVAS